MIDTNTHTKTMTVKKLKQLLNLVPDDCLLEPNLVGNIAIRNLDYLYLGFIDFNLEMIDVYDESIRNE